MIANALTLLCSYYFCLKAFCTFLHLSYSQLGLHSHLNQHYISMLFQHGSVISSALEYSIGQVPLPPGQGVTLEGAPFSSVDTCYSSSDHLSQVSSPLWSSPN